MVHVKGEDVRLELPEEFNLSFELVDRNVEAGLGDKVAFYFTGDPSRGMPPESITYNSLVHRICRAGNALRGLGVEIEDRVSIVLPDIPEFIESFLGAIRIGAQPVPLSTILTKNDYLYMINDSKARVLIMHQSFKDMLMDIRKRARYLKHVVVVGEARGDEWSYFELMKDAQDTLEPEPMSKDDFCFWLYSSGTTGPPKGVIHHAKDALVSAETYYRHVLGISPSDINFSTSKLFFAYGLGNTLYGALRFGASSVLYPGPPTPESVFDIIQRHRVSVFFSVPTVYARLLSHRGAESMYDLSSLRLCVSAGEALPAVIYEEWKRRFNVDILDGMGTTELTHIVISNRPGRIRPGSSGVPVPGYEVKIIDEDGAPAQVGKTGRLLVKGESTAALYWRKHEKTRKTFLGEWYDTGDAYYVDEDGYFWHAGRMDDLIKSGGIWVSPVEVESALLKHPAVLEAAVVQGYTEAGTGRPKAFVVLKEGYTPSQGLIQELREKVRAELGAGYKVPSSIEFVRELPKTPTGKIQRYKLRDEERRRLLQVRGELMQG